MRKGLVLIILILLSISTNFNTILAKDYIRGNFALVGNLPKKNSFKKVIFEEFINFG